MVIFYLKRDLIIFFSAHIIYFNYEEEKIVSFENDCNFYYTYSNLNDCIVQSHWSIDMLI